MADTVVFTSQLTATRGLATTAGSASSTKTLDEDSGGIDLSFHTVTSTEEVAVELDMADVWKSDGHAVKLRNIDSSATHEPCVVVGIHTAQTVTSGNIKQYAWYLVSGDTITYDGTIYAIGDIFKGTATTTFTGSGVANLIVEVGRMYPGDFLGPIRRAPFTAALTGSLWHWVENISHGAVTCRVEVTVVETKPPTS